MDSAANLTQDIGASLKRPLDGMSWLQLAAATVFVLVVVFMWRQVTLYIGRDFS